MTRLRTLRLACALLAGLALSLGSAAHAGVVYDNLSAPFGGDGNLANPVQDSADSFSTGAAGTLGDVKLLLLATTPGDGGAITVNLLSDSSTSPGSVIEPLGTISDSSLSTSYSTQDVSGFPPVALSAGTRYWIQLVATTGRFELLAVYDGRQRRGRCRRALV